jgi:DNA-binding NarL/FixJ family response regulator
MATILLAGVDLFFRGKLEAALPGHRFVTADSVEVPDLVICDIARIDPDDVVETYPEVPILGFTNHNDTAGLRSAHAAGFDHVVVKSALEDRARDVVQALSPSLE